MGVITARETIPRSERAKTDSETTQLSVAIFAVVRRAPMADQEECARQTVMAPHAARGLHMRRDIRGDLSSEDDGEHERAIFHDRHHREIIIRFHHLLIPFLLKLGLGAREAAI